MQAQRYEPEGREQANAFLISSNSTVMAKLEQMTETMNAMQVQLKTLISAQTKQSRSKWKQYFWNCGRKYTIGSKNWLENKTVHQEEVYHKKRMGESENRCEWK